MPDKEQKQVISEKWDPAVGPYSGTLSWDTKVRAGWSAFISEYKSLK